jgi:hypothetical protein
MKTLTTYTKILILFAIVMVFSGIMFFPNEVDAKKSSGNYLSQIGSNKVCGDKLCVVPLSIEEKISAFLDSKKLRGDSADQQIGRFSEGGVSQQSTISDFQKTNNEKFDKVDAKKSSGSYFALTGPNKVCGDKLCVAPLSMEEKIAAFMESKKLRGGGADQQGRFSEGGVFFN